MARQKEPEFWLKDRKKSLGESFSKITNYSLPPQKVKLEEKEQVKHNRKALSSTYIRMEQIELASKVLPYSMFLEQVGINASELVVNALDLFIRCLKPNVKVTCQFNEILKSGVVELVRSECTLRICESVCEDSQSILGKAVVIEEQVNFNIRNQSDSLVMENISGLRLGFDILGHYVKTPVRSVSFRTMDEGNCLQIIKADNPLYELEENMPELLTFLRITRA